MVMPWLLGSVLLLLAVKQAAASDASLQALAPPQDPPDAFTPIRGGPPAVPNSPPDVKTPETILQLSGSSQLSSCSPLQQLFSNLLDSGSIFSRNQLCYLQPLDSSASGGAVTSSPGVQPPGLLSPNNQTEIAADTDSAMQLYWFILSAVLPSYQVAEYAVVTMGHTDGPDIDTFIAGAGVPCDDQLVVTTQTEDQDAAAVYVYSCNGMLVLPGGSVPLALPAICCAAQPPRPPRRTNPPLPPSALPPWIEELEPPPPLPQTPVPVQLLPPAPPRAPRWVKPPPPPPANTDGAQLMLFVMASPEKLYCAKLLAAAETLAQPYGLATGNYSCRSSTDAPPRDARYGVMAPTAAASFVNGTAAAAMSSSAYMVVKAEWSARAYSRHFKRLQAALASSIDVFASLGMVPCGTEVRALLLTTTGGIHREDAFGCVSFLPEEYQTALQQRGLRVLPRQQLCCRPPPPPGRPPQPPPKPPRRPPQAPLAKPVSQAPPGTPAPASSPSLEPVQKLSAGNSPRPLQPFPRPPPSPPLPPPVLAPGAGDLPPPWSKDASVYNSAAGAVPAIQGTLSPQLSPAYQAQGLSREAIAVIAVLATAAVLSTLAVLFVLYRRRLSPTRAAARVAAAIGLAPVLGYTAGTDFGRTDGNGGGVLGGGGGASPGRQLQPRLSRELVGWPVGKDDLGLLGKKAHMAGRGEGEEGSGPPSAGILLTMTASESSSLLTDRSSPEDGLRAGPSADPAEPGPGVAPAARQGTRTGPYGDAVSLELHDGDIDDTVAVVRTFAPGSQRPPSQAPHAIVAAAVPARAGPPGLVAAPHDGSAFGFMDVFRGAAANHICLSTASSVAPSAVGVLAAAGAPKQLLQNERQHVGASIVAGGQFTGGGGALAAATHGPEQQQHNRPVSGMRALQAREVTLLDLFKQSPLAGAMLSSPSTSSGGAPPSPTRSLSVSRRTSGAGATAAAAASRQPSLTGLRPRSSPAVALERLSVQLAWNIARLSCNMERGPRANEEDTDGASAEADEQQQQQDGMRIQGGSARHAPPRGRGGREGSYRGPVSGPQPRLPCWTMKPLAAERQGGGEQEAVSCDDDDDCGGGKLLRGGGRTDGSSGSAATATTAAGSAAASEAASGGRTSETSGRTAAMSSAGGITAGAASDWEAALSPGASARRALSPGRLVGAVEPAAGAAKAAPEAALAAAPAPLRAGGIVDMAMVAAKARGGGGSGGGGDMDLDISPKELRIQTDGLLGAGAFGSVYRGSYRGQPVAIKVLHHLHFAADGGCAAGGGGLGGAALLQQKDVDSFRQEIAILRMLAHPNIVRVLGGCAHAGHPFLVMELMPRCLHNVIHGASGSGLGLAEALRIATDVARGLAHLHPAIVHRDLKPANILLDANGTAKISDFGLARYHLKPYISTQQPDAGSVAYMAPEGFDPAIGRLSAKCDVYSFGVLLWELITKEHPWAGESNVAIIYRVAVHRMRLPMPADPQVCPPRLAALLEGCMSYAPSYRPDMRHVLSELETMSRLVQEGGVEAILLAKPPAGPSGGPAASAPPLPLLPPPSPSPLPQARAFGETVGAV